MNHFLEKDWIYSDERLVKRIISQIHNDLDKFKLKIELQSHYAPKRMPVVSLEQGIKKFNTYENAKKNNTIFVNGKKDEYQQQYNSIDNLFVYYFTISHFKEIQKQIQNFIHDIPEEDKKIIISLEDQQLNNFLWNSYPYNLPEHPYYMAEKEAKNHSIISRVDRCPYYKFCSIIDELLLTFNHILHFEIEKTEFVFPEEDTPDIIQFKKECLNDIYSIGYKYHNVSLKNILNEAGHMLKILQYPNNIREEQSKKIDNYEINTYIKLMIEQSLLNNTTLMQNKSKVKVL